MVHGSRDSASFETRGSGHRDHPRHHYVRESRDRCSNGKLSKDASRSARESLQVDPLRPVEVPSGDVQEMIGKAPKGSVIVSFMGPPPLLSSAQRRRLEETKPAIVAFCPGSLTERVNLPALFEQGLLQTAVVSRRNPPPSSARPKGLQAWFDQAFIGIASTDAAGLSLRSDAQPQGRFP